MFAFEIPGMRYSLTAGAAIERHRFVSVDASSNGIVATASTPVVGVSMNKVAVNEVLEVADGIVMVEAGGAVTPGAGVASNATGQAVASADASIGVALTGASAAGELITIKL